jgi:ATP adenylyltransferase
MNQPGSSFDILHDFLTKRMRMSHIYQPVMLRLLIENGGWAGLRDIAAAFLARDESQIEYYSEITKRMPAKVLAAHDLVEREGDGYRLIPNIRTLKAPERAKLIRMCDDAITRYLASRGDRLYRHRRLSLGEITGTDRYEVLKRAGFRCELCGTPADERALDVDHILPRNRGGSDDRANLQALCYRCNGNKGDRDDTDFRTVREGLSAKGQGCIFCALQGREVVAENSLAVAFRDAFPVTPLHTLIVPKRHVETYFGLFEPERRAISLLLDEVRHDILQRDSTVGGFNIGMNSGAVAGQTVMHAHVHLIPRRAGDVQEPRGGVRGVIPGKASY